MLLVVHLMQEDSPKLLITSPTVIEGEIQHGYELVTGFENILCAKSPEQTKHGTSQKYHSSAFSTDYPSDSLSSSSDGLHSRSMEQKNVTLNFDGVRNNHRTSGTYVLKENGHIVENSLKLSPQSIEISAPATPGHIHSWEADMFAHYNETKPVEPIPPKRQSTRRKPFFRQNAQEMNTFNVQSLTDAEKNVLDTSYL